MLQFNLKLFSAITGAIFTSDKDTGSQEVRQKLMAHHFGEWRLYKFDGASLHYIKDQQKILLYSTLRVYDHLKVLNSMLSIKQLILEVMGWNLSSLFIKQCAEWFSGNSKKKKRNEVKGAWVYLPKCLAVTQLGHNTMKQYHKLPVTFLSPDLNKSYLEGLPFLTAIPLCFFHICSSLWNTQESN